MKYVAVSLLAVYAAMGQTGPARTGSIAGTVLDAETLKPVPAALVIARRVGVPPFASNTRAGGDGGFQIQGLIEGDYSLCVQSGDQYLDPCLWNGNPVSVTLAFGRNASGITVKLAQASIVTVQVKDAQNVLRQTMKDGRSPDLTLGVWGPRGLYAPAGAVSGQSTPVQNGITTYSYHVAVPRDITLGLYIASRDLKLGDADGVPLPANASRQAFQHATGDANRKSFTFTVLGLLP